MCGILFHVSQQCSQTQAPPIWWDSLAAVSRARGPDAAKEDVITAGDKQIRIQSSVLALRGELITRQPIYSANNGLLLLWNGEVFDSLVPMDPLLNDGVQIMTELESRLATTDSKLSVQDALCSILSSIEGPYSMVLYDRGSSLLYFGRDPLGRRSLLIGSCPGTDILLCSAASKEAIQSRVTFSELDCSSLWKVSLLGETFEPERMARLPTPYTLSFRLRELQDAPLHPNISIERASEQFLSVLSDSVRKRVCHLRLHGSNRDAQVALLFSGGLDCCTLAMLAHQHIDPAQPIDLLNVAFENPRVLKAKPKADGLTNGDTSAYDVPDRKTGLQSVQELQRVAPNRQWNFVEVNVSHAEYQSERDNIESLMAPCQSVMDLSISAALYFACRGRSSNGYTSSAKVLLSGLGADELLGGYSRHRKAFAKSGMQGLVEELQMDLDRLSTRNLGRDDRILSSSGKEARYPYLCHSVVSFLADLPVEAKMDFVDLPPGQGDKKLLREVARALQLEQASLLVKRAIQFGARSAKMEIGDGKIMGHEKLKG